MIAQSELIERLARKIVRLRAALIEIAAPQPPSDWCFNGTDEIPMFDNSAHIENLREIARKALDGEK